jgi:hypothetical protein
LDGRNGLIQGESELELRAGGGAVDGDTDMAGVSCDGGAVTGFEASDGATAPVHQGVDTRMDTNLDDSEVSDGSTTQDSDTDVETESSSSSVEDHDTGGYNGGVHVPRTVCLPCKLL